MKKIVMSDSMTRTIGKIGLTFKKYSPEIMVVAGVVGTVVSAVMACKATTKVSSVIEESKAKIDQVHDVLEDETISEEQYSIEDSKKDLAIIYAQTGLQFAKLYGPSVVLGALSIVSILAGHNMTRKRNAALAAAYITLDKSFKEYRSRVIERFGKELDNELRFNIKKEEIKETATDEKGKKKTTKKVVDVVDPNEISDFARIYDVGCTGWTKSPEDNLIFLKLQQSHANDKLKREGYLFLNDVYKMLGIPATRAGQIVGWYYDENDPLRDNFVDFGIYDTHNAKKCDFVNGYERSIVLDFNVDGPIIDLIGR